MSIHHLLAERVKLQAKEAEAQNLNKLAKLIFSSVESLPTRNSDENYQYNYQDLFDDVTASLTISLLKVADYYGAKKVEITEFLPLIEKLSSELIEKSGNKLSLNKIGAYEKRLPGEISEEKSDIIEI